VGRQVEDFLIQPDTAGKMGFFISFGPLLLISTLIDPNEYLVGEVSPLNTARKHEKPRTGNKTKNVILVRVSWNSV
jgi:hypothetical protein